MDIKKLREMQKGIEKKAGGNDDLFLYSGKLTDETNVRLMPEPEDMNGVYFVEQEGWWVKGTFYPVNTENGGDDIIQLEIDAARGLKDADVDALLDAKNNGMAVIKKETRYLLAILLLDVKYDENDVLQSVDIVDDKVKVLVAKPTLLREINAIVGNKQYQNQTKHGIADRVKGWNLVLSKTGSGINTEYGAIGWTQQTEMPEKYYNPETMPHVGKIAQKQKKEDAYLSSVIRNYMYGEAIIEDIHKNKAEAAPAPQITRPAPAAASAAPAQAAAPVQTAAPAAATAAAPPAIKKPVPPPAGASKAANNAAPAQRSLADDLLNSGDELKNLD